MYIHCQQPMLEHLRVLVLAIVSRCFERTLTNHVNLFYTQNLIVVCDNLYATCRASTSIGHSRYDEMHCRWAATYTLYRYTSTCTAM